MYEHKWTVPYEFDTSDITDADMRDVTRRHYDFTYWCKYNTTAPYHLEKQYDSSGITVSFENKEDFIKFLDFAGNCYWIFLHN